MGKRGRKYSNDNDDDDDVSRVAVMASFYHDYRAAILHATRCRYSTHRLGSSVLHLSTSLLSPSPSKLAFRRVLPFRRRQSLSPLLAADLSYPFPSMPTDESFYSALPFDTPLSIIESTVSATFKNLRLVRRHECMRMYTRLHVHGSLCSTRHGRCARGSL